MLYISGGFASEVPFRPKKNESEKNLGQNSHQNKRSSPPSDSRQNGLRFFFCEMNHMTLCFRSCEITGQKLFADSNEYQIESFSFLFLLSPFSCCICKHLQTAVHHFVSHFELELSELIFKYFSFL